MSLTQFLEFLAEYRYIFLVLLDVFIVALLVLLGIALAKMLKENYEQKHKEENALLLKNMDYSKADSEKKASIIRQCIMPDGIDTAPNGYMVINDGGVDVYIRCFTIVAMPKRVSFRKTFSDLLNFPSSMSSISVTPIADSEMSRKLDRQVVVLESEHYAAEGNSNRQRKLAGQYKKIEKMAEKVESGDEKYFRVRFLFAIKAPSLDALNRLCDEFHGKAVAKQIIISACYSVHPEAYASIFPFNQAVHIGSKIIGEDIAPEIIWSRPALSTLFNYSKASFTHRNGIPLGRDLFTKHPFLFDIYDPSHDGFTICIAGKTGSGKSVTIKVIVERCVLEGYRFVAIDSQARKGLSEGEYAALAELVGGVNIKISNNLDNENRLNPYHVEESVIFIKETASSGYNQRTLDLLGKITLVNSDIRTMMSGGKEIQNDQLNIYIDRIISDANNELYASFGIYDKNPDSLYEYGDVVVDGMLQTGYVPKKLPTITDFYKKILLMNKHNKDHLLVDAYSIIIQGMKDWVKELYYSEKSVRFFSKEEYTKLPYSDDPEKKNVKVYKNEDGEWEEVISVHGIRPYFDGQSTIKPSQECAFTNFDISQLTEFDKVVARQILMSYITEQYVKKNSETLLQSNSKLVAIFDEAHENFKYKYARVVIENSARTVRKRNLGLILCTQTIKEYDYYDETREILKQSAVRMICRQDPQDTEFLQKNLALTDTQTYMLTNVIGFKDEDDDDVKNKHRGEMCVCDANKVQFIKVDMLKRTEALSSETSAEGMEELYKVG